MTTAVPRGDGRPPVITRNLITNIKEMIITLTIIGICACFGFIVVLLTAVAKE